MDYKETIQQMISDGVLLREDAEKYCPELIESEDEMIKKEITELVMQPTWKTEKEFQRRKEFCAWIEKQGEQKPVDKIQLGKRYKCIASPRYSTFVRGLIYKPEDNFLCSLMNFCSDCFEPIEDGEQKSADKVEPKFKVGDVIRPKGSMAEYTIESIYGEYYHGKGWGLHISCDDDYELVEQKPAEWSEEDEKIMNKLLSLLLVNHPDIWTEFGNWLKSIKDRVSNFDDGYKVGFSAAKHNHWKPSARQMSAFQYALGEGGMYDKASLEALYNDLKKL